MGWRRTQPAHPTGIAANNPLSRGLVLAVIPIGDGWFDAVSRQYTHLPNGSRVYKAPAVPLHGLPVHGRGDNVTNNVRFAAPTGLDRIGGPISIFVDAALWVDAATRGIVGSRNTADGDGIGITFDDVGYVNNGVYVHLNNNNISAATIFGANSEQSSHRVLFTADGTDHKWYTAGKLAATFANTGVPNADTGRRTAILARDTGVATNASTAIVLAWNRVLYLPEFLQVEANPWQVFEPAPRMVWVPAAGGGGGGGGDQLSKLPDHLLNQISRLRPFAPGRAR